MNIASIVISILVLPISTVNLFRHAELSGSRIYCVCSFSFLISSLVSIAWQIFAFINISARTTFELETLTNIFTIISITSGLFMTLQKRNQDKPDPYRSVVRKAILGISLLWILMEGIESYQSSSAIR